MTAGKQGGRGGGADAAPLFYEGTYTGAGVAHAARAAADRAAETGSTRDCAGVASIDKEGQVKYNI